MAHDNVGTAAMSTGITAKDSGRYLFRWDTTDLVVCRLTNFCAARCDGIRTGDAALGNAGWRASLHLAYRSSGLQLCIGGPNSKVSSNVGQLAINPAVLPFFW
jgi:hypothetical protein